MEIDLLRNSINKGISQAKDINLQDIIVPDINEEEEFYFISTSDINADNISEDSDIKTINDKNTFSKDLQDIESDIKIANGAFDNFLKNKSNKFKKGNFNRLYLQYDKIAKRLEKVNNYSKRQEYFNDQ